MKFSITSTNKVTDDLLKSKVRCLPVLRFYLSSIVFVCSSSSIFGIFLLDLREIHFFIFNFWLVIPFFFHEKLHKWRQYFLKKLQFEPNIFFVAFKAYSLLSCLNCLN